MLFFKFKNYSSFINDSSLLFCILIFNPSVLKIKHFSLDLCNQKPTNEETYRICWVDVNTIAFNHAPILAHLLLLTLTTKYRLDSINLKGKLIRICMGHAIYHFINIVIYQLLWLLLLLLLLLSLSLLLLSSFFIIIIIDDLYIYIYIYILLRYIKSQWSILSNLVLLKSKGVKIIL